MDALKAEATCKAAFVGGKFLVVDAAFDSKVLSG